MNARCKRVTWLAAAWFSTVVPVCGTEQAGQAVTLHASRPSEIAAAESPADRTLFPTQVRPRQFLRMQAEGFAGTRSLRRGLPHDRPNVQRHAVGWR